jgi:hypothetical protein
MKPLMVFVLTAATYVFGGNGVARAEPIVIGNPPDPEASNCFPFGCGREDGFEPASRYQQVYNRSQFKGPLRIREIQFYQTDSPGGNLTIGSYEFYLSTTSRGVDQLASDFDSNLGRDNARFTVVPFAGGAAPALLSIRGSEFLYNPARGNLLLDIMIPGGARHGAAFFDARQDAGGLFSRAQDFGEGFEGWGLVTGFVGDPAPIPEPSSLILVAGGAFAALMSAKRRNKQIN